MNNKEFLKELSTEKANFYPYDFHFHSIASFDLHEKNNNGYFVEAEIELLERIGRISTADYGAYEEEVIKKVDISEYYQMIKTNKDVLIERHAIDRGNDWAVLAITDHNVFKFASLLSAFALPKWTTDKLVILPGVELEIITNINNSDIKVHVLIIFEPGITYEEMYYEIRTASGGTWVYGSSLQCSDVEKFVNQLRNNLDHPAMCIAAHISSSKGLQNEMKKAFTAREAQFARTKFQLESPQNEAEKKELEESLESLIKEQVGDTVDNEVLTVLGKCGFDALQVRSKSDEPYYQYLHRFEPNKGRNVLVTSSDSHTLKGAFAIDVGGDSYTPFIKIDSSKFKSNGKLLFNELRNKAVRYGETRIFYGQNTKVERWIEGILVEKEAEKHSLFWTDTEPLVLPLSRNLNCLIGGRGTGKSAIIEMIEFVSDMDQFKDTKKSNNDWYERAKETLYGCRLTVCWRILSDTSLKKKVLFRSFYFDQNGRHTETPYTDIDGEQILDSKITEMNIIKPQILRIHEIEDEAAPTNLLSLFDKISGVEKGNIGELIKSKIVELKNNRLEMIETANEINVLCDESKPIREYARRKYQYDKVNSEEIKTLFERIDYLDVENESLSKYKDKWSDIVAELNLDVGFEAVKAYFDSFTNSGLEDVNITEPINIKSLLGEGFFAKNEGEQSLVDKATHSFNTLLGQIASLSVVFSNVQNLVDVELNSEKEQLAQNGLPMGSTDREVKKESYEESVSALLKYNELIAEFKQKFKLRKALKEELTQLITQRSERRESVSSSITKSLSESLNDKIIVIQMDAQPQMNKENFKKWLKNVFDWGSVKYVDDKINKLICNGITSELLALELCKLKDIDEEIFVVSTDSASDGRITKGESKSFVESNMVWQKIDPEVQESEVYSQEFLDSLPENIRNGVLIFKSNGKGKLNIDGVLQLDEEINDDVPVVRLNDRPSENGSVMKDISRLSPGQRCSAILPILLLHGSQPLIIDQPEDNLDNRLIRQVIVSILNAIKLKRQVILATHNPNIPVLGDAENVLALRTRSENSSEIIAKGTIDSDEVIDQISKTMEGGREALQYRYSIYQEFWHEIKAN